MSVLHYFDEESPLHHETMTWHEDGVKYTYNTKDIVDMCKDEEVFDIPLKAINCTVAPWNPLETFADFMYHVSRMSHTDLNYPIILTPHGSIANGYHRVAKAMYEGRDTIKAVKLKKFPEYCIKTTIKD